MTPQALAERATRLRGRNRHIEGPDAIYDHACSAGELGVEWQPDLHWPTAHVDPFVVEAFLSGCRLRRQRQLDEARHIAHVVAVGVARVVWRVANLAGLAVWELACLAWPRHCARLRRHWRAYKRARRG